LEDDDVHRRPAPDGHDRALGARRADGWRCLPVYVRDVLAPTLRRGDVVVLDNLPAHKVAGIREAITARRAQLFYLPAPT
jgi:hypothetical protein